MSKNDSKEKNELKKWDGLKKIPKGNSLVQSTLTITGVMVFAFLVMFMCQKAMGENKEATTTFTKNSAEESYYNVDYDAAIGEYETLQTNEEWPMYKVKEAEVYSAKGDYAKSNKLLLEAYNTRNKLIDTFGKEKYEGQDGVLGSSIITTALLNGENTKAFQYGEVFMLDNASDKGLNRTMFTACMITSQTDKAREIVNNYNVDTEDSYDLAIYAQMNSIINDSDKTYEYLKKAWEVNNDEIKIYDVIESLYNFDSKGTIKKLNELSKNNPEEECYKVWLAKCYSLDSSKSSEGKEILEKTNLENGLLKVIEAKIESNLGNAEESEKLVDEAIKLEGENFNGNYISAEKSISDKDYKDAFEYAKKSILENENYPNTYSEVIPEIMADEKQSNMSEPYIRTAIYKEPFNYDNLLKLGQYYWSTTQNLDKSYKYFELALSLKPDDTEILYNMAMINLKVSKTNEAIELLNKCIKLNGNVEKYHKVLGAVYLENKDYEKAIKEIRAAYAIDDKDVENLNNAAYYYMTSKEYARAMTNFKAAYEGMKDDLSLDSRKTITNNYNKVKAFYKANGDSNESEGNLVLLELKILY